MAILEQELRGDFDRILRCIDEAVQQSVSASLEGSCDFRFTGGRCAVRVYERYSFAGGNRVSLNVTLLLADGHIRLSAITSGGSQAIFCKVNTWGEESFLDSVRTAAAQFAAGPGAQ